MFSRMDWTLFRNLGTISQKAGVPIQKLRRVVFKEMVDNALDAVQGQQVEFGIDSFGAYWVEDKGPGIDVPPERIAQLFSINRPLTSSKILRVPSRGALGNGLRVIVGSAMASGGSITLETKGRCFEFGFNDSTGQSEITSNIPSLVQGTRLTVKLGDSVPKDEEADLWARLANALHIAKIYDGKSSSWWYDSDSFYELMLAAEDMTTIDLVKQFNGIKMANPIVTGTSIKCKDVTREQADVILERLRTASKPVSAKQLGNVGFDVKRYDELTVQPGHGRHSAVLPYCIEAYATPVNKDASKDTDDTDDDVTFFVNATPITGRLTFERRGPTKGAIFGCGLRHKMDRISRRKFRLFVNITIPYMPITTDGKEPNFEMMAFNINKVMSRATSKFKSAMKKQAGGGQRDIILANLQKAVKLASGDGEYRYSLRQLFYAVRPYVLQGAENQELDYNYFARVITEAEAVGGQELPGIYRDPRGTLYHPHLRRSIPIGTMAVEEYERPKWTFNKILYCEKEGFFSILNQVNWPEKNDCALLSSKGFASRAVRDVLDLLGETEEEILFFCIHDADASGTLIYQALTEGTTARAARKVKIINLGLDPWEAVAMGLQIETFVAKRPPPVATYVNDYDDEHGQPGSRHQWRNFLQNQRVELNAMTSPKFLEWLDEKMKPYHNGKVIPPDDVMRELLMTKTKNAVRARLTAQILNNVGIDDLVNMQMQSRDADLREVDVKSRVRHSLSYGPEQRWDNPIEEIAAELAK